MVAVAAFVSSHGYGHAARSCAVIAALEAQLADLRVELFTTVPRWFFEQSLTCPFTYHRVETDIGLVQRNSLEEDVHATAARLAELVPPPPDLVAGLAELLRRLQCQVVVCDISALGLAVARHAGCAAVLVENFTWEWIYAPYLERCPALAPFADHLAHTYKQVRWRVQTEPVCRPLAAAVQVPPVARSARQPRSVIRRLLGVPDGAAMVLLTVGGIPFDYGDLAALRSHRGAFFVVPGAVDAGLESAGRLLALAHHSDFFHPDLVAAADLVVGKVGYSTLAEVYHSRAAFAYVPRPRFPESPVLGRYVEAQMNGVDLVAAGLDGWRWLEHIDELAARRSQPGAKPNGAHQVAEVILSAMG